VAVKMLQEVAAQTHMSKNKTVDPSEHAGSIFPGSTSTSTEDSWWYEV